VLLQKSAKRGKVAVRVHKWSRSVNAVRVQREDIAFKAGALRRGDTAGFESTELVGVLGYRGPVALSACHPIMSINEIGLCDESGGVHWLLLGTEEELRGAANAATENQPRMRKDKRPYGEPHASLREETAVVFVLEPRKGDQAVPAMSLEKDPESLYLER
jgi:hypothetical protein